MVKTTAKRTSAKQTVRTTNRQKARKSKPKVQSAARALARCCLNARHGAHLPLPRAVGPYAVIRRTHTIAMTQRFGLFGPMKAVDSFGVPNWTTCIGVLDLQADSTIGTNGNAVLRSWLAGNLIGAEAVPAAFTVRVLCSAPYNTAAGIVYIGQCKQKIHLGSYTATTWTQLAQNLVAFAGTTGVPVPSLLTHPRQVHAVPGDLATMTDFEPLMSGGEGAVTISSQFSHEFAGLLPIYVYNPNTASLQLEITTEWRMRFPQDSPMQTAMQLHPPSSERTWYQAISDTLDSGVHVAEEISGGVEALFGFGKKIAEIGTKVAPVVRMLA